VLPWEHPDGQHYSARMFLRITMRTGRLWATPARATSGAEPGRRGRLSPATCIPEIEFYLLKTCRATAPADPGGLPAASSTRPATTRRRTPGNAIETLESMGISVEFSHHEGAPGQQEIDLRTPTR